MAKNFSRAFTFIELLVVMIVVAILFSIAYPVYTGVLERAKVTKDMNNLRQIGVATQTYMNDNDGVLFTAGGIWMTQLHPKYLSAWNGLNGNPGYGTSIAGLSVDKIKNPSVFIMFAPAQAAGPTVTFGGGTAAAVTVYKNTNPAASGGTHSSRKRINALFADLHAETMDWTTFINDTPLPSDPSADLRWSPYIPYP